MGNGKSETARLYSEYTLYTLLSLCYPQQNSNALFWVIVKYINARNIQLIPLSNQVVTGALRIDMLYRLRHRPTPSA
jgi:hypothetical protein